MVLASDREPHERTPASCIAVCGRCLLFPTPAHGSRRARGACCRAAATVIAAANASVVASTACRRCFWCSCLLCYRLLLPLLLATATAADATAIFSAPAAAAAASTAFAAAVPVVLDVAATSPAAAGGAVDSSFAIANLHITQAFSNGLLAVAPPLDLLELCYVKCFQPFNQLDHKQTTLTHS